MKMTTMIAAAMAACACFAADDTIKLPAPDLDSGVTLLTALKARHSCRAYSEKEITLQELSGVLWAANGFNRPDKRTNATGLNRQEIEIYACMKSGTYRYDAKANVLVKVYGGDLRKAVAGHQDYAAKAPVSLLIVADVSDPVYATPKRSTLSHYDAGIVSANIYLYCAANGLETVCRGSMDSAAIKKALNLSGKKLLHLNHPVGYPAKK